MVASFTLRSECREKAALLIALSYEHSGQSSVRPLNTTHADMDLLAEHLVNYWGYPPSCITKMRDGDSNPDMRPTRKNILREIANLVRDVRRNSGDRRVFYFAGHCYQVVNRRGTEEDNLDEFILVDSDHDLPFLTEDGKDRPGPIDFAKLDRKTRRKFRDCIIIDNELRRHLVDPIPVGAKLVAISDTCNSGTLFDLDYNWQDDEVRSRMKTLVRPRIHPRGWWKMFRSWDPIWSHPRPHTKMTEVWRREEVMSSIFMSGGSMRSGALSPRRGRSYVIRPAIVSEGPGKDQDHVWFEDRPRCSSPPPGEVPEVISIASSQDGEMTMSGNESMTLCLIRILEEQSAIRLQTQVLNHQLNIRMGEARCNVMQGFWTSLKVPQTAIQMRLPHIKSMQRPVIGSLSREAPSRLFEL